MENKIELKKELESRVAIITKDNIHLYYEFMSDKELKYNHLDLICEVLMDRVFLIKDLLGIKDTLKPMDEYIEEIKASDEYKEYIFKAMIESMEQYQGIYNLSINDNNMIPCINSDYHRILKDLLESLECLDLDAYDKFELWKTNGISSLDPEYYYENINFITKDIEILIRVIKEYTSTK
jgi:hypothetical protein